VRFNEITLINHVVEKIERFLAKRIFRKKYLCLLCTVKEVNEYRTSVSANRHDASRKNNRFA